MASKTAAQAKLIPSKQKPVRQVTMPPDQLHWGGSFSSSFPFRLPGDAPPKTATAPGAAAAGAAAGTQHQPVKPFNTPEESQNYSDRWAAYQGGIYDIDTGLANLRTNTEYEKGNIDKELVANKATSIDNMIGRGLDRSSIQDGELADLQGTAVRRKTYLDTTLSTAVIEGGRRKEIMSNNWDDFINYYNNKAVQNAQDIPPTPGTPDTPAGPAQNPLIPGQPLSTGFAGLDPNKRYRQASNGKLQIQNSNGTWRYA